MQKTAPFMSTTEQMPICLLSHCKNNVEICLGVRAPLVINHFFIRNTPVRPGFKAVTNSSLSEQLIQVYIDIVTFSCYLLQFESIPVLLLLTKYIIRNPLDHHFTIF